MAKTFLCRLVFKRCSLLLAFCRQIGVLQQVLWHLYIIFKISHSRSKLRHPAVLHNEQPTCTPELHNHSMTRTQELRSMACARHQAQALGLITSLMTCRLKAVLFSVYRAADTPCHSECLCLHVQGLRVTSSLCRGAGFIVLPFFMSSTVLPFTIHSVSR